MAAFVENRRFRHELGLSTAGVVCSFNHQHSGSPIRSCNYPTATRDFTTCNQYDSDDDDEDEVDYRDAIKKANSELESFVFYPRDLGTSDHWIERNPSMVRLTGKHPFNFEPPLTKLMQYGFITPSPIHYVRNHGPVSNSTWEDWTVEICGLFHHDPASFRAGNFR
ncbi:hypothetical protein L6452_03011 [Arctium lappa]|uniref:Uncharacterized protein n=1 Tax=Arctium lappa TaxID=4217 RepID=A0ACB9FLZ5_ARCLA|nr:hypothetical protein L6452_03011 [Arctium lappa]